MSTHFRRSSYYSRVLVPTDLRGILQRREFLKSLRTESYREAVIRGRVWEAKVATAFNAIRGSRGDMTSEQAQAIIQRHLDNTLRDAEEARLLRPARRREDEYEDDSTDSAEPYYGPSVEGYREEEDRYVEALHLNNYSLVEPIADSLLKQERITLDKATTEYRSFCRDLVKACLHSARVNLKRELEPPSEAWPPVDRHPPVDSTRSTVHHQPTGKLSPTPPHSSNGLKFSQTIAYYFAHYSDRRTKTVKDKVSVYQRFMAILGDRPIASFTKHDVIRHRDILSRFPRKVPKRFQGRPVADLLAYMDSGESYIPLSRASVNADLADLRHLFEFAIRHDYYEGKNPCDGLAYEGIKRESYDPYTDSDLAKIFTSSMFLKERDGRQPERYWLPLIFLHSGTRREEVAARLVTDIRQEGDIWYIDIAADEARDVSVKNETSERRVPIHSRLIALGFLQYVERVRSTHGPASLLFPVGKLACETAGDSVSKWHKRVVDKCVDVAGRRLAIHSYRSTVISKLHEAGVKGEVVRALVGHEGVDVHEKTYLHVPLPILREAIEKLDFKIGSL